MKVMAFKKISVLTAAGKADGASYIAAGDLCTVGIKNTLGLWQVTYPTRYGPKVRYVRALTGFLCNQNEYGWLKYPAKGYEQATVKSGGCGVCAAVNALGALTGRCISVQVMRDLAVQGGARVPGGTDMRKMCELLKIRFGVKWKSTSDVGVLQTHLQTGGVAICNSAGKGLLSTGGHYVTALGMTGGKVCIADPGLYAGKYRANVKRMANVTVSGDLIFVSPEALDQDCTGRAPRYYLLRR